MHADGTAAPKSAPTWRRLIWLAIAIALCPLLLVVDRASAAAPARAGAVWAQASGVKSLDELMNMRIKKVKGKRVAARGSATGTVEGKVDFNLVITNGSHATASFHGENAHGTISGTGVASYRVDGAVSYYTGTVTSLTGTGRYAHADERGISFSGTVNRRSYAVIMHLRGKWHV
jgi:hypothetical protein